MQFSITCLTFICNIRFTLQCKNTSRASRRVCLIAQVSQPCRSKLQGISRNMRYSEYKLTWSSSQKDAITPIEASTEAIRLATSLFSRSKKDNQEPKYLKQEQKVTFPSATAICFVYVSAIYTFSSRLHFFSYYSPLTFLDLRIHNVFSPLFSHDTVSFCKTWRRKKMHSVFEALIP